MKIIQIYPPRYNSRLGKLLIVTLLISQLTSCSSESAPSQSIRSIDSSQIQKALRTKAYSQWDAQFPSDKVSWNTYSNRSPVAINELNDENTQEVSSLTDQEIASWRKSQADTLEGIPSSQLQLMCEMFFEDFMQLDAKSNWGFKSVIDRLKATGLTPYSVTGASLLQDNRETMEYPKIDKPSFMIVCGADIKFRDSYGKFRRGKAYISWAYVLVDGEAKFNFPYFTWSEANR